MSRSLRIAVDLTVADDANDEEVADYILDLLCAQESAPYESCDSTEYR